MALTELGFAFGNSVLGVSESKRGILSSPQKILISWIFLLILGFSPISKKALLLKLLKIFKLNLAIADSGKKLSKLSSCFEILDTFIASLEGVDTTQRFGSFGSFLQVSFIP